MRVVELAQDLNVSPEQLLVLLRQMGIAVGDKSATVSDADIARVLARVEKERRAGGKDSRAAVEAAIEDSQSTARRRRRRRRADPEPEPEVAGTEGAEEPAEPEGASDEGRGEKETAEKAPESEEVVVTEPAARERAVAEEPETSASAGVEVASAKQEAVDEAAGGREEDEPSEPIVEAEARAEDQDRLSGGDEGEGDEEAAPPAPAAAGGGDGDEDSGAKRKKPQRVLRKGASKPAPAASAGPGGKVRIQAEGYTSDGQRKRKGKKGKKRQRVDQDAVQDNIQRVMAEIKGSGGKKRRKGRSAQQGTREERAAREEEERQKEERAGRVVKVNEFLTAAELSDLIDVPAAEIIGSAFKNLGMMVTVNQRLDFDQIELLLEEFGFEAERQEEYGEATASAEAEAEEDPEALVPRPPVVTVMGHVDHGKTLLLDYIRKTNVVAGESGGITQHIGAYHVETDDERSITFLDTPGHAAFTAMRARGADVTDIVVLVVAADDSIMPQTIEAISHARNAGVPVIVAINKMDLPAADANRVRQELLQHEVTVEEFGGDVLSAEVSAKSGQGMDDLLEKILLQAELLELRANPDREAQGIVIEAKLDVGKGPVVTVLVQRGTLRVGESFIVGRHHGRVRAMLDERGNAVEEAPPGVPVQILGSPGVPQAGDHLTVMEADRAAEIAQTRQRLEREKELRIKERGIKLGDFSALVSEGKTATLPLVIKGDVDGSVQALSDALEQLGTDEVSVEIIHRGVGAVNESDVLLAQTAGAVIIAFRVRPDTGARTLAEREGVDIHAYEVIYEAVDEVRQALEGLLAPEEREEVLGSAEVRETFRISRTGTVAGCYVTDGVIRRSARVRLVRDGSVVYTGNIGSLKRFKDDVREVREGFECGLAIENFNDVKVGDVIECFTVEEVARTLAAAGSQPSG